MTETTTDTQQTYHLPRIGDAAPEFTAESTQGPVNFPSDYKGKWVNLCSHPVDITPGYSSEFMTFAFMENVYV